jgi:hypothetical protein
LRIKPHQSASRPIFPKIFFRPVSSGKTIRSGRQSAELQIFRFEETFRNHYKRCMPEKNKSGREKVKTTDENCAEKKGSWSEDQKTRRYYYDDAHGYEIYRPEEDEESDEEEN